MMTDISGGLNRRGIAVTHHLNPYLEYKIPVVQPPACICVEVVDGYGVLIFTAEGQAFRPEESSFHTEDFLECHDLEPFEPTGVEPQLDPAGVVRPPGSSFHGDDAECVDELTQFVPTGLEPQVDPAGVVRPAESSSHTEDSECCGTEAKTVDPTGIEPQVDPPAVSRPKESGSERDRK